MESGRRGQGTEFVFDHVLSELAGTGMSSGVNFAVPINTVRSLVPRLIVYGTISPTKSSTQGIPSTRKNLAGQYSS